MGTPSNVSKTPVQNLEEAQVLIQEVAQVVQPSSQTELLSEERLAQLAAKSSVGESLLRLLPQNISFTEFTREVLLCLMQAIPCEASSILEFDPKEKTFFFRAATGCVSDQLTYFRVPWGEGVVGHVAKTRTSYAVSEKEGQEKLLQTLSDLVGFEVKSLVAFPLMVRGEIYGVLELLNRAGGAKFEAADIELLRECIGLFSYALETRLILHAVSQNVSFRS